MKTETNTPAASQQLISKSTKLAPAELERLTRAARREGVSVSEFLRLAAQEKIGFADTRAGQRRRRFARAPEKGVAKER